MGTSFNPQEAPDVRRNTIVLDDLKEPEMYKVILHNDDYTTMDFVVQILREVFNKSAEDATEIMLAVHNEGAGICGIYTYEVAEYKVFLVLHKAEDAGFPLKCTMEKA